MKEFFATILYYPFINLLTFFIWLTPGHYAVVGIILLTLVVRLALILPSKRAAQGQRRMSQLQPLMDELKVEYADDRQGLAAAQMELYKKNGINPFSSCGLALIQLPVLYILYFTILHGLTPDNPNLYSWIPRPESINTMLGSINLLHPDKTYILPVLAAALQFVQTRMTLPPQSKTVPADPQQTMQRNMMYLFPLLTLAIAQQFPAGVALYWVATTLFSIAQQYFVNKEKLSLTGVEKVVEKAERLHPGHNKELEKVEAEILDTKVQKGVSVTVRKKKK